MNGIIYKAENKINGKVYIGQTIQGLSRRKTRHKYDSLNNIADNFFYRAIRKHGWENFEWSILCETDSESKLNALEKFYIAAYRKMTKCYNSNDGGGSMSGYKASPETCQKLREINTGRIITDEHRRNISKARKGIKLKPFTEDHKRKIGESNKGKIVSQESIEKMKKSKKGKKLSENHKLLISKNMMGEKNHFYGKKHSPESIKKMSEAKKGKYTGKNNPNFGNKWTDEQKKRMSEIKKEQYRLKHGY